MRKIKSKKLFYFISHTLIIAFIFFITTYTLIIFSDRHLSLGELIIYFMPTFALIFILKLAKKHKTISGILFLGFSFVALAMYRLHISIAAFLILFTTGVIFLSEGKSVKRYGSR